jgi:DNA-binding MarR family transcriptional regulator
MQNDIDRMAGLFAPIMHRFHLMALDLTRVTEFTLPQYRVLMLVHQHGRMTISELQAALNTAQSTASEMVIRLEEQRLLVRSKDTADRRKTVFTLSETAEERLEAQIESMNNVYRKILEGLDEPGRAEFLAALESVNRLLDASQTAREA